MKTLICLVGMSGAGKRLAWFSIVRRGIPVIELGYFVRIEMRRRGLAQNPDNENLVATDLRREEGEAAVAKRAIKRLISMKNPIIGIEWFRSIAEVEELKKYFEKTIVISVIASRKTRLIRSLRRNRKDCHQDEASFMRREKREIDNGIEEVVALADYPLLNEGSEGEFNRKMKKLLDEILPNLKS